MLMPSKVFRAVGGFTPAYFMYAEDMDLCFKVLKAGFRIYHVPTSEVVHHGGASSSAQGSSFSAVMTRHGLHCYMSLNRGRLSAWTYRAATAVYAALRLLIMSPSLLVGSEAPRRARRASFLRWWAVLSWSCGQQKWTKRYDTDVMLHSDAGQRV